MSECASRDSSASSELQRLTPAQPVQGSVNPSANCWTEMHRPGRFPSLLDCAGSQEKSPGRMTTVPAPLRVSLPSGASCIRSDRSSPRQTISIRAPRAGRGSTPRSPRTKDRSRPYPARLERSFAASEPRTARTIVTELSRPVRRMWQRRQ